MKKKKHLGRNILLCVLALAVVGVAFFFIKGYLDSRPKLDYINYTGTEAKAQYPDTKFAVMSDIHTYDESLGTSGAAFDAVMYSDRKLLLDSKDLIDLAIGELLESDAEFILISGDLTKDGELVNHEYIVGELKKLVDGGKKVFVVPGNHDVNNPDAVRFIGDDKERVDNISAEKFAEIYTDMGYGDSISRDKESLSYITEAKPGLWILGLDFCRSDENTPNQHEIVAGRMKESTMLWLADVLSKAASENAAVIAISHHGIVEHWEGQSKLHPDYLVDDYKYVGEMLASYNVRMVFTGHYHAQDIAQVTFDSDKYIFDIETGSLVTYPCPMRYCTISGGNFNIESDTIIYRLHPDTSFAADAKEFVKRTVYIEAFDTLKKYKVSDKDAEIVGNAVSDAFIAHYYGDEVASQRPELDTSKLGLWGRVILATQGYVLDGMWKDLFPSDNTVTLSLR